MHGGVVAGVATIGLMVNLIAFAVLSSGKSSLNVRAALSHVIGDMLGSAAALLAGAVILLFGWMPADPILSAVVALLMVRSGWLIARESAHILLEGAPADTDGARVTRELLSAVPAISNVHHLHVWSLTDERPVDRPCTRYCAKGRIAIARCSTFWVLCAIDSARTCHGADRDGGVRRP